MTYNGMRFGAVIPARAGSKGIPGKNMKLLAGSPLVTYTIRAALESSFLDEVIVTSDDPKVLEIAQALGASTLSRSPELASDHATTIAVVINAIASLSSDLDAVVLLQPTSPLRTARDIDQAIIQFRQHHDLGLAAVSPVKDNPILVRTIEPSGALHRIIPINSTIRRQDMPSYYRVNGSIYINRIDDITHNLSFNDNPIGYIMSESAGIDIDEPIDLDIAEWYLSQ